MTDTIESLNYLNVNGDITSSSGQFGYMISKSFGTSQDLGNTANFARLATHYLLTPTTGSLTLTLPEIRTIGSSNETKVNIGWHCDITNESTTNTLEIREGATNTTIYTIPTECFVRFYAYANGTPDLWIVTAAAGPDAKTLQVLYNNSNPAHIVLNTTNEDIQILRDSAEAFSDLFRITDNANSIDYLRIQPRRFIALGGSFGTSSLDIISFGGSLGSTNDSDRSLAIGQNSRVNRREMIAIGTNAVITAATPGTGAISIGQNSESKGSSIALGFSARSPQPSSCLAIGPNTSATSFNVVIGDSVTSTDNSCFVIGLDTQQGDFGTIIIGKEAKGNNFESVVIGFQAETRSRQAIVIGTRARVPVANDNRSIVIGTDSIISGVEGLVIGNNSSGSNSDICIGSNCNIPTSIGIAIGENNTASGSNSILIGENNSSTVTANAPLAIGNNITLDNTANTIVLGNSPTIGGTTNNTVAIGNNHTVNNGIGNIIIGSNNEANGVFSTIVMGTNTTQNTANGMFIKAGNPTAAINTTNKGCFYTVSGMRYVANATGSTGISMPESGVTGTNPNITWGIGGYGTTTGLANVVIYDYATISNTTYSFNFTALGARVGGVSGNTGDCWYFDGKGYAQNVAGTLTLSTFDIFSGGAATGVAVDVAVNGTNLSLNATGITNYNIDWQGDFRLKERTFS